MACLAMDAKCKGDGAVGDNRGRTHMSENEAHGHAGNIQHRGAAHLIGSGQMLELCLRIWISRILVWVYLLGI